jgi:hypothetical protein
MDIHNFQTLDDQQKQDLKKRLSNDGYFKLEVGAFKQNLEMFLKRGKSSAFYKDKQKQETFLSDISRQKLAYNNLIESLKELHDDAFFEQQKSNLKPLYDQLLDFENKIKKSQGILKFTRGLLKENGLKVLKKLKLIKAPKITQPDPIEVFLKDPLLFLQNESYTIRNQLRRFQTMNKGESLNQQLETLKAQIGKISLKQAKIKLAQCENEQKVLEEYKVLYDTYTFLSVSESCAFEKTVNAEGKVVPLTNEAVVRFIATSLGIGLLDVFSLPRQELYDKLIGTGKTKDKVVGENVEKPDQRYRNLSHVLSNDFLWALELQKLEGHPISIDHVHAERQLLNFLESYPNLNQAGHMESIDALIKEIRTGLKFPVEEPVAAQDNDHFFDAFETLPVESEPSMPDDKGDVFHDPVELLSADQDFVQTPPPSISIIEEEPTVDEPPALSKVRSGDDSNEEFHDALPLETAPADPVEELPLPGGFLLKDINEFAIQVEGKLPIRFTNKEKQLSDINLISKEMIEIFKILTTPKQNGRSPRIAEVKKEFTEKLSQLNFFTIPKPTLEQKRPAVIDVEICNFLQINSHVLEKLQPDLEKLKPDLKE